MSQVYLQLARNTDTGLELSDSALASGDLGEFYRGDEDTDDAGLLGQ